MTRPFRPDELTGSDQPADPAELAAASDVARLIERRLGTDGVRPTPGFSDRVMAAVATQPAPRRSRLAVMAGALRTTWQTALSANRPPLVRAKALAIVLAALIALGSIGGAATLAAAGALNLLQPHPTLEPVVTPNPQPSRSPEPVQTQDPRRSPAPTEIVGPAATPEPTETSEPGDTPEPSTSDHSGGGDGSSGGGGGGDGSGGGKATPDPGRTAEPHQTPEPTEASDN